MDVRRVVVPTHDWRDLCVSGRGYIETVDDNGENPIWFRSIVLCLNQNSQLCANVDGKPRLLEPPISVPPDWTQIDVSEQGTVLWSGGGTSGQTIGGVSLSLFAGDDLNESDRIANPEDRIGVPMRSEPGMQGAGVLKQRAALLYCVPLTVRSTVAFTFFALWVLGGIAFVAKKEKP